MFHQNLLLAKTAQKSGAREPGKCSSLGYRGTLSCLWGGEECLLLVCVCWFTYDTCLLQLDMPLACAGHRCAPYGCVCPVATPYECVCPPFCVHRHATPHGMATESPAGEDTTDCVSPHAPAPRSLWSRICLQPIPSRGHGGRTTLDHKHQGSEWLGRSGQLSHRADAPSSSTAFSKREHRGTGKKEGPRICSTSFSLK